MPNYLGYNTPFMIQHVGWLGGQEIVICVIAILLFFGGKKIPGLAKDLSKNFRKLKDVTKDNSIKDNIQDVASEITDIKSTINDLDITKTLPGSKRKMKN